VIIKNNRNVKNIEEMPSKRKLPVPAGNMNIALMFKKNRYILYKIIDNKKNRRVLYVRSL
jgi:hypothetical protein